MIFSWTAAGSCSLIVGSSSCLARDLHGVRARLAAHRDGDAPLVLSRHVPGGDAVVLDAVLHLTDVGEAHRRALPEGDHDLAEVRGGEEPAGGLDRVGAVAPLHDAGGKVRVGVADRRGDLVEADAPGRERARVELDRTAYFSPKIATSATPGTVAMRCATRSCA